MLCGVVEASITEASAPKIDYLGVDLNEIDEPLERYVLSFIT